MKNKPYLVMCIDGQIEEFETIEDAKQFIKEEYVSQDDGIHPDIESIFIMKRIIDVKVKELDNSFHQVYFDEVKPVEQTKDYNGLECGKCNCVEIAEKRNGGQPVKNLQCLKDKGSWMP